MELKKVTVYTCIIDDYDILLPPPVRPDGVRFLCFTDRPNRKVRGWEMLPLKHPEYVKRPDLINRYHKIFPHQLISGVDWSIYVDGNVCLTGNISSLIEEVSSKGAILACPEHPRRSTIFEEADACEEQGKFSQRDQEIINRQLADYVAEGMPRKIPLTANYLIIRNHHSDALDDAMQLWWKQLQLYTRRDQISLPYVLWKTGINATLIKKNRNEYEPYYLRHRHKRSGIRGWFQQIRLLRDEVKLYHLFYKLKKWLQSS